MSDPTPGGWPDAARPGVPQSPERDGWHWLQFGDDRPIATAWVAELNAWASGAAYSPDGVVELGFRYLGPCLTPAEVAALTEWRDEPPGGISKGGVLYLSPERVAAQVEAARREGAAKEREAIAQMHDIWADRHHPDTIAHTRHKFCAAAIRARGDA